MENSNEVIVIIEQKGTYGMERVKFRFTSSAQAFIFANTLMTNSDGECSVTISNRESDVNEKKED